MRIRPSLLLGGLLTLAAATSCTTASEGAPRPATSSATETSSSAPQSSGDDQDLPFAGAPKVAEPLDTTRFEQDPCRSLSSDQARGLTLPETGTTMDNVALGKGCEWNNKTTQGYVQIVFVVDDPRGLSPEYQTNERGDWAYFKELPEIEGYPAITRASADRRDLGTCVVVVGVADDMSFETIVQLSQVNIGVKDPCTAATEVAGLALETMKKG